MSVLTAGVGGGGTEPSFLPTHLLDKCTYNHKVMHLEMVHTKTQPMVRLNMEPPIVATVTIYIVG